MLDIYVRAKKEVGYNATYFFKMLNELRGLRTARALINSPSISDGFTALYDLKRLDLTVEAMTLERTEFHSLFTEDELTICRKRLNQLEY